MIFRTSIRSCAYAVVAILIGVISNLAMNGALAKEPDLAQSKRIDFLIEALASKNREPQSTKRDVTFSEDYDPQAQALVYLAIQQLAQEGAAAFEALEAHFDDARYSFTCYAPSARNGHHHVSVGQACRLLLENSLLCYKTSISRIERQQESATLWQGQDFDEWWEEHRSDSLWKLQVAAIDVQLAFQEALDYQKAETPRPFAKKPLQERFEELRRKNIVTLKKLRASIEGRQEAFLPKPGGDSFAMMTMLPWTGRLDR